MRLLAYLLGFLALLLASRASSSGEATSGTILDLNAEMSRRHEQWMRKHGRVYSDENERERRFQIFKDNVASIDAFNNAEENTYTLAVNQFADLTIEEMKATNRGCKKYNVPHGLAKSTFKYENVTDVPSSVDWRMHGIVSPVRDQGSCRACWAFTAVDAVEGITAIKYGRTIVLSPQELIDCIMSCGCFGGAAIRAFSHIKHVGLPTEQSYPYKAIKEACNTSSKSVAFIKDYERVPVGESALMNAVAHQPIAVSLDSNSFTFKFYGGGVYTGECSRHINHEATAVGYGVDDHGTKYWLVKNSWGTHWGENGYMRMKRDISDPYGLCGIAADASYPTA